MSDPNPNQLFDNYSKEFSLRIELLRAAGQYAKDTADARHRDSETLSELEKNRTRIMINKHLKFTLNRIEKEQRVFEDAIKKLKVHSSQVDRFQVGNRPFDLNELNNRIGGVKWFLEYANLLFDSVPPNLISPSEYVNLSQKHELEPPVSDINNCILLLEWMKLHLCYPAQGGKVHQYFHDLLVKAESSKDAIIAELQSTLDLARKGQYEKMHELLPFLQIKEST